MMNEKTDEGEPMKLLISDDESYFIELSDYF
jgi:hypothetical protein